MELVFLTDNEIKQVKEIQEITMTRVEHSGSFYSNYDLRVLMFDLLCEYHHKEEELEDLQNDLNEHYTLKHVDEYEEYGVNQNDFI